MGDLHTGQHWIPPERLPATLRPYLHDILTDSNHPAPARLFHPGQTWHVNPTHRTTPHAPSLKSYTPKTTKDTITSNRGARSTRTRIHNHSRATNTTGRHTPLQPHNHQPSPPLTWTHTKQPHGRRYSYNQAQTLTHKAICNNASSPSPQPLFNN